MKKKGFTLIELLAVIVVLAIIALIATPIVMNVIKKANAGAAERSADNYVKAVETLIATEKLDGTPMGDGEYEIDDKGNLTKDGKEYEVEVSGTKSVGGTITIKNGQVVKDDTTVIEYEGYTVKYPNGKAEASEKGEALVLCTAIAPIEQPLYTYKDWYEDGEMIDTLVGNQATKEKPYIAGATYKCDLGDGDRIFYVLKEEDNNVKLLMEENIGNKVAWCASGGDNSCNGDGAIAYLNSQTVGWTKLKEANGMVNLPSYDDVWLGCRDCQITNLNLYEGYWTSTRETNDTWNAYIVDFFGNVSSDSTTGTDVSMPAVGVRPMITISKENMSL